MSISLNNHETRIKALEGRSGVSISRGSGYVDFSRDLQIRYGTITVSGREIMRSFNFSKPFSNGVFSCVCSFISTDLSYGDNTIPISGLSKTGFNAYNNVWYNSASQNNPSAYYIAIGY